MHRGYVKLFRKIRDSHVWPKDREFTPLEAWIDLLMMARHDPEPIEIKIRLYGGVSCGQGQIVTSLRKLGERWNWGKNRVRRFLNMYEARSQIGTEAVRNATRITICNYSTYNDKRDTSRDAKRDSSGTVAGRKRDTIEEECKKNGENEKKTSAAHSCASDAEKIYQAYPRKVGKRAALAAISRALGRLGKVGPHGNLGPWLWLLERVKKFAESPEGRSGQYCLHPERWFDKGRYDDDESEWQRKEPETDRNRNAGAGDGNSQQTNDGTKIDPNTGQVIPKWNIPSR